jgi:hypothetical protein
MKSIATKCTKWLKRAQHSPFQGLPKYTKTVGSGMKIYHLATLLYVMSYRYWIGHFYLPLKIPTAIYEEIAIITHLKIAILFA